MHHKLPTERSAFYLPKYTYLTAYNYAHQYPYWIKELKREPAPETARGRREIEKKAREIENIAKQIEPDWWEFLLEGATGENAFYALQARSRHYRPWITEKAYYLARRKLYYEVAKRI